MNYPHPNIIKLYFLKSIQWFMVIMPLIILFFESNDLNYTQIMILQATYSFATAIFEIPSGYTADLIGKKKSIFLGSSLSFIGFLIFSLSNSFVPFLIAEIILGIGNSFISGSDSALLFDSLKEVNKSEKYLKYEGINISIGNFSEALSGIIGGLLASISIRYPAIAQVIIAFIAIPISYQLTEPKVKDRKLSLSIKNYKNVINYIMEDSKLIFYIIFSSSIGLATLIMAWLIQPLLIKIGIEYRYYGFIWAFLNIIVGFFSLNASKISSKISNKISLIVISIISIITYLILFFENNLMILITIFLFYSNRGYATPYLRNEIQKNTLSEIRATVMSIRNLTIRFLFVITAPFVGIILDNFGLNYSFLFVGTLLFIILFFLLNLFRHNKT